ncbi:hypothetical protein GCM10028807_49250 [Spirosoma daeguense]
MVPLLYAIVAKSSKKYVVLIIIYLLSITYRTYLEGLNTPLMSILSRQTPGYLSYFVSGILFYEYFDFYKKNQNKLLLLSVLLFIIELYSGVTFFHSFALAGLIFYIAYNFPALNKFGKYGDFSYGMYIFHFTTIQIFVYYSFFEKYNPIIGSILVLMIAFFLATLSWQFIEKPFLKRDSHTASNKRNALATIQ